MPLTTELGFIPAQVSFMVVDEAAPEPGGVVDLQVAQCTQMHRTHMFLLELVHHTRGRG